MASLSSLKARCRSAQSDRLRRLGASGNLKHAKAAEEAPRKYAAGGSVGAPVEGASPTPRLDTPSRHGKKGKKGKKDAKGGGKTNVNVIIMGGGDKGAPMPMPPPGGPGGPPPMGAPHPPMPMPPPGAGPGGPPPMPMRARGGGLFKKDAYKAESGADKERSDGGKVCRASGGRVPHIKEGGGSGLGRLAKIRSYGK